MRGKRYPEAFKIETVKQVTDRGNDVDEGLLFVARVRLPASVRIV
jgi:transposase-like protein